MTHRAKVALLLACVSVVSLAVGAVIGWKVHPKGGPPAQRIRSGAPGGMVNPLLDCEESQNIARTELVNFKKVVQARIDRGLSNKEIVEAGYYFRQLNDGIWMGIREREKILPGSLLKIPLAMAIMRKAELDRDLLERQLVFSGRPEGAPVQMFDTPGRLETGKSYRVAELVERMLRFSDNDAIGPLREIVPDDEFDGVLRDLNVGQGAAEGYQADLKTLSSFMRTLYNAGYLTIESAERLLEILSDPWFDRGIAAGVPEGVVVASKYGDTIKQVKGTDYFQFHEFGIVYLPTQPYLIGVYAVGAEMDRLVEFTRDVSAITFAEVESQVAATRK